MGNIEALKFLLSMLIVIALMFLISLLIDYLIYRYYRSKYGLYSMNIMVRTFGGLLIVFSLLLIFLSGGYYIYTLIK